MFDNSDKNVMIVINAIRQTYYNAFCSATIDAHRPTFRDISF